MYGGAPIRSATFGVQKGPDGGLTFQRSPGAVKEQYNTIHSYSPVNVSDPHVAEEFPAFESVVQAGFPIECRVEEGDAIYVPSNWWHEVSTPNERVSSSIVIAAVAAVTKCHTPEQPLVTALNLKPAVNSSAGIGVETGPLV